MKYLFEDIRLLPQLFSSILKEEGLLLAFDFDGTLARLTKNPSDAALNSFDFELLQQLSQTNKLAIISGRSRHDVLKRVPSEIRHIVGNHGLEGEELHSLIKMTDGNNLGLRMEDFLFISSFWKNQLPLAKLQKMGITLEDKGYSLTLHYRNSDDRKYAQTEILRRVYKLLPSPRVIPGKLVFNLIPPGAPNKGHALQRLMSQTNSTHAIYVGDEDSDEDVFCLRNQSILSIRVGKHKQSAAQYYIKSQIEITRLLETLNQLLQVYRF